MVRSSVGPDLICVVTLEGMACFTLSRVCSSNVKFPNVFLFLVSYLCLVDVFLVLVTFILRRSLLNSLVFECFAGFFKYKKFAGVATGLCVLSLSLA